MSCSKVKVFQDGSLVGTQRNINLTGSGVSAVNNPGASRVDVAVSGASKGFTVDTTGLLTSQARNHWRCQEAPGAGTLIRDSLGVADLVDQGTTHRWTESAIWGRPARKWITGGSVSRHTIPSWLPEGIGNTGAQHVSFWGALTFRLSVSADMSLVGHYDNATSKSWRVHYSVGGAGIGLQCLHDGSTHISLWHSSGILSINTDYKFMWYHDAALDEFGIALNGGDWETQAHSTGIYGGNDPLNMGGQSATLNPMQGWLRNITLGVGSKPSDAMKTDHYNDGDENPWIAQ